MLSENQIPSKTTVLLVHARPAGQSSKERVRLSQDLVLVALASTLVTGLPSTTLVELVRQLVCRLWNKSHGNPPALTVDGTSSSKLRDAPEIA